jgi:hypothetical protein
VKIIEVMDVLILAIHLGERGELILALHPYEIRFFACSRVNNEIDLAGGHIMHERGQLEEDRFGVCER